MSSAGSARSAPDGPPARRRGAGTAADMVRSLLVIGVLVAVVFLAVPRPQGRIQQPVDVAQAVEEARAAGLPAVEPTVPAEWEPNAATFEPDPVEGLPTFSVGYVLPDESFAGLRITTGATPAWVAGFTADGRPDGEREVAGATWQQLVSPESASRRSLVLVEGPTTTLVTGTAEQEALDALAEAARAG